MYLQIYLVSVSLCAHLYRHHLLPQNLLIKFLSRNHCSLQCTLQSLSLWMHEASHEKRRFNLHQSISSKIVRSMGLEKISAFANKSFALRIRTQPYLPDFHTLLPISSFNQPCIQLLSSSHLLHQPLPIWSLNLVDPKDGPMLALSRRRLPCTIPGPLPFSHWA